MFFGRSYLFVIIDKTINTEGVHNVYNIGLNKVANCYAGQKQRINRVSNFW